MFRDLLRWARITKPSSDDKPFAVQQMEYLGKIADGLIVFPYGHHGNVPADALALMMSMQSDPDNRAAIAWTPKNRPRLKAGEVTFYHPPSGSTLIWDESGNLLINNGSATLNLVGNTLTLTGNLVVNGTMTNNGKDVGDTHQHSQANDSGGDPQQNINGVL